MLTKICTGCKEEKELDEFSIHPGGKHGRHSRCKECRVKYESGRWRSLSEDKKKVKNDSRRQNDRKYFLETLDMTLDQFKSLVLSVEGKCQICGEFVGESLCIDHDHRTGKFRGLLCRACNFGIGQLKDDPTILDSASRYLRSVG